METSMPPILFLRIMPQTALMKPMCMAGSTISQPQAARLPKKRSRASRRKSACQTVAVLVRGPFIFYSATCSW